MVNELKTLPGLVLSGNPLTAGTIIAMRLPTERRYSFNVGIAQRALQDTTKTASVTLCVSSCKWLCCFLLKRKKPVVRMAFLAGQFAKPESEALELQGGLELPATGEISSTTLFYLPVKRTPDLENACAFFAIFGDPESHPRLCSQRQSNHLRIPTLGIRFFEPRSQSRRGRKAWFENQQSVKLMELLGRSSGLLPFERYQLFCTAVKLSFRMKKP